MNGLQPKTANFHWGVLCTLGLAALFAVVFVMMGRRSMDPPRVRIDTLGNHRFFGGGQWLNVEVTVQNQRRVVGVTDFHSKGTGTIKKDFDLQPDWHIELQQENQIIKYVADGREYVWDFTGPVSKTYERKR